MSSDTFEIRLLQQTPDGAFKVVQHVKPVFSTPVTNNCSFTNSKGPRKLEIQPCPDKRRSSSRPVLEQALLSELQKRLQPQKSKVDQQIEARRLSRLEAYEASLPTQIVPAFPFLKKFSLTNSNPPNVMDELKQRLNKICISSNYEVDRIVKETKTTTTTESRETIHFRPQDEKLKKVSLPETSASKRLSVRSSPEAAPADNKSGLSEPSHTYVNITELNEGCLKKAPGKGKDLLGEYVQLEEDIKDINQKNKELREKFFQESKGETPILTANKCGTSRPPSRSDSPLRIARPPVRLLTPRQTTPSTQTETKTGYVREEVDYRIVKTIKPKSSFSTSTTQK